MTDDTPPMSTPTPTLRMTADLPGVRAEIKSTLDAFEVEEVPAYEPSGEGPHIYLWVQKRDASAKWALGQLARHFGVRRRDIGQAGLKDRHAITRQWYSLPAHQIDEDALAEMPGPVLDNIEVLEVSRHRNKLKRGHLRGNRFTIRLDLADDEEQQRALERAQSILAALEVRGVPNYYDDQRFGHDGHTLELGMGLLRGDKAARDEVARDRFLRRLALNAAQSELFNRALSERLREGTLTTVWQGDVLAKRDTGGIFVCEEPEVDQARLDNGELVITGPMFGPKMRAAQGPAQAWERGILAQAGLGDDPFADFARDCPGTRRHYQVWCEQMSARALEQAHALAVEFFLPSGSYATIVCKEIMEH